MTAALLSQAPPDLTIVASNVRVSAEFSTTPGSANRALTWRVDGSPVATWTGGVLTSTSPYIANLSAIPSRVAATLDRTGGWLSGAHAWEIEYTDGEGNVIAVGSFAIVTVTPAVLAPPAGQSGVPRRPLIYAAFDVSVGTPVGVDVTLNEVSAVEGGAVVRPHFEGASGGSGTRAYVGVQPRRGFRWGAQVSVQARPRVAFGGDTYLGLYEYRMNIGERPASKAVSASGTDPLLNPVAEAARQLAAIYLRPRPASPPLGTALRRILQRATIGQLAPDAVRRTPVALFPEDDPGDAALRTLVEGVAPLWGTLLSTLAPEEEREALDDAWRSGHVVERNGAISLLLLYAIEGRDAI